MSSSANGTMAERNRPAQQPKQDHGGGRPAGEAGHQEHRGGGQPPDGEVRTHGRTRFTYEPGRGICRGSTTVEPLRNPDGNQPRVGSQMDYDTYGSSAVELAIDLANAELNSP